MGHKIKQEHNQTKFIHSQWLVNFYSLHYGALKKLMNKYEAYLTRLETTSIGLLFSAWITRSELVKAAALLKGPYLIMESKYK